MESNLFFDFTVDKTAKTVFITRDFDADLSLVWEAFTTKEILDQWTAPAPFVAKTKHLNFEVGGKRFYAMVGPEGQERWIIQKYNSISPKTNFKLSNAFADAEENPQLPGSEWDYNFIEKTGPDGQAITQVYISIYNESFERMESLLEGFKEGFKMTLENLDNYLQARKLS